MKTKKKHEFQFWISWNHFSVWLFFLTFFSLLHTFAELTKSSVSCVCSSFPFISLFVLSISLLQDCYYVRPPSRVNPIIKLAFQFFSFSVLQPPTQLGCLNRTFIVSMVCSVFLFLFFCLFLWTISTILANLCLFKCIQKSLWSIKNSSFSFLREKRLKIQRKFFEEKKIKNLWSIKPPWQ